MSELALPARPKLPGLAFVSRPEDARAAVAFIHGLGGDCYQTWGPKGAPATFLERAARDLPDVAIATFGHQSGLRLFFRPGKLKVEQLARVWAGTLRDSLLERYRTVGVVCHSLGGVITMAALRHLLTTDQEWERRVRERESHIVVVLMGVPQEGADTHHGGWISNELEVLTYSSDLAQANLAFWKSRVQQPERAQSGADLPIATYAVVSERDRWVPQLSASANLAENAIRRVALSHSEMVKPPKQGEFEPYDFVLKSLRRRLDTLTLPQSVQRPLDRYQAGLDMVFERVQVHRVVERPWLDREIDEALASRNSGYVHLDAKAGAGKTAYMARMVRDRKLVGFFFDASQGITAPTEMHVAVWAQLVARKLLPPGQPPERLGTDARVLRGLLEEAAQAAGKPILLAVDALDEASSGAGPAALLPLLPEGVFCLTSSRPQTRSPAGAIVIPIDVEGQDSHDDVRRYAERRTAEPDIDRRVKQDDRWSGERLVATVSDSSGGLFAFAHFVLSDVAAGRLGLDDLEGLSPGLSEYYRFTWNRWGEQYGARFRRTIRRALAAVAVARAPISSTLAAVWAGVPAEEADDSLREALRPWVSATRTGDAARFRLYHRSVGDFLLNEAPAVMRKVRGASASHMLSVLRGAETSDREAASYASVHAIRHLIGDRAYADAADLLLDLEFLDDHRRAAGGSAVMAELMTLSGHQKGLGDRPVAELLHAWSDEEFAIRDTPSLLAQFSYRLEAEPRLRSAMGVSMDRLARRSRKPWFRCTGPVAPRSTRSWSLRGHRGWVNDCLLSSDSRRLISASDDGTLRVWDLASPESEPAVLSGHEGRVYRCVLSPDEKQLISASMDMTLRAWDLTSPESAPVVLRGHQAAVTCCALGRDGLLASGSDDGTLRVWRLAAPTDAPLVLQGHSDTVRHCVFSSDARQLVSASADGTLRLWDLASSGSETAIFEGHDGWVNCCVLTSDDRRLVSGSEDGTLRVWEVDAPQAKPLVLLGHDGWVNHCILTADDRRLVSASEDGTLRVWDLAEPQAKPVVLRGHTSSVTHCVFSSGDRRLVSASDDGTLRVWDLAAPRAEPVVLRGHEDSVKRCVLSSDDRRLVSASDDRTLRVWDLASAGSDESVGRGHDGSVTDCALSHDGRRLVSASEDGTLRIWDVTSPASRPAELRGHEAAVNHCALSSDDRRLVSASTDRTLRLWDLEQPRAEPLVLQGHEGRVRHCALSSDGRWLVSASDDETLRLWDLEHPGSELAVLRGHEDWVSHCALSADGRRAASASEDGTLRIWDLAALDSEAVVLRGHEGRVNHCVLTRTGERLVSASEDGTLRVWDLTARQAEPVVLRGHEQGVNHCLLSADERMIVSASWDGTLRVWDLTEPGAEPAVLRGHDGWVNHSALSQDGRNLLSGSGDGTLRLWDLVALEEAARFRAVSGVTWVGWAQKGHLVCAGDGSGRVWMLELVIPEGTEAHAAD